MTSAYFRVAHITRYRYDAPVRETQMQVLKAPRDDGNQRLQDFQLVTRPRATVLTFNDALGNAVHHFGVPSQHRELVIQAQAFVEVSPPPPPGESGPACDWDVLSGHGFRREHFDMLQPHGFCQPTALLKSFLEGRGLAPAADPLSTVTALARSIASAFAYAPQSTQVDSPIDHALATGKGVCQDFAHIMIATCRLWGIPARYVSGYLYTRRERGDRSEPDASHAWLEVFVPAAGWIGFDPTNDTLAGERHIRVAIGRDYNDVPPTRGVFKGPANSELAVAVAVTPSDVPLRANERPKIVLPMTQDEFRPAGLSAYEQQQQQQQ